MSSLNVKIVGLAKCFLTCSFTLLSSLYVTGLAQDITEQKIDSLRSEITELSEDTAKVNRLLLLSDYLLKSNKTEQATEVVNQAENLAQTIKFTEGIARSLIQRGEIELVLFNHDSARKNADQALAVYQKISDHSGRAQALHLIAKIYGSQSAHDDAIAWYQKAVDEAEKGDDKIRMANAQLEIANQYNNKGQSDKATMFAEQAKEVYENTHSYQRLANTFNTFGEIYRRQARYSEAMENFYQGLKIAEDHKFERSQRAILNNIGIILLEQKKLQEAIDTYLELITLNQKSGNLLGVAYSYNNIGLAFAEMGEYEQAIKHYNEGLKISETIGSKRTELSLLYNIGESYNFLKKHDQALLYFNKSYQLTKETSNHHVMAYGLNGLGLTHIYLHQYDKATQYLKDARSLSLKEGYKEPLKENYRNMVKLDSIQGHYKGAFQWYKKYESLKDSLNNELKSKHITEIQTKYESEKKDKKILQLNQTKELEALRHAGERRLFFVIVLFLALLAVGLIYVVLKRRQVNRVLRSQKREIEEQNNELNHVNEEIKLTLETVEHQNRMLHDRNIKLQELHREKDGLIGVVAHDLRSPIAKAQGLADLMKHAGPLNEKQLEFNDLIRSVCKNGMRLIEDLLMLNMAENSSTTANCTTIDLNKFLTDQMRNYEASAEKKDITLHYNSQLPDQFQITSDRDYLIRIIDNLVSNAIKFTFPYHAVFFDVINKNDHVVFTVRDEGQGMSEEDKSNLFQKFKRLSARPTAGETSTGLGLSIVKTLIEKLEGSILVESEVGKGTTFIIEIPLKPA